MGYHRAGFEVVGVDIKPQPHYPFEFIQADALHLIRQWSRSWPDGSWAIHASPPCQLFTAFQHSQPKRRNNHLDLITPTRPLLAATGLPWVIENVPGAPLLDPITLCGSMFGLGTATAYLPRHRIFEASFPLAAGWCQHPDKPSCMVAGHGKDGYRGDGLNAADARAALGIDWMNRDEMAQAIPPVYTEWIGRQLVAALERDRLARRLALADSLAEIVDDPRRGGEVARVLRAYREVSA
jgi:DNA (cytosine-5)-methyltransferase 1